MNTGPKIFNEKGTQLSAKEVAQWANVVHRFNGGKGDVFTERMFTPHGDVEDKYRLGGYHCDCGCDETIPGRPSRGEFGLIPLSDSMIREGGKAYMQCKICGCYSHL